MPVHNTDGEIEWELENSSQMNTAGKIEVRQLGRERISKGFLFPSPSSNQTVDVSLHLTHTFCFLQLLQSNHFFILQC